MSVKCCILMQKAITLMNYIALKMVYHKKGEYKNFRRENENK